MLSLGGHSVDIDGTTYDARVVSYDPNADISILDVPNLSAQPLRFTECTARTSITPRR
jgi:S1-C subfamily serine protease